MGGEVTDALLLAMFAAGVALISCGAWLLAPAAGLIVAGAALVLVSVLYVRGRRQPG